MLWSIKANKSQDNKILTKLILIQGGLIIPIKINSQINVVSFLNLDTSLAITSLLNGDFTITWENTYYWGIWANKQHYYGSIVSG